VTSGFLYYMAFVFGGKGVAELQEGGLVPTTIIPGGPRFPALGIYPTVETLLVQGILLVLLLIALVWTFLVEPRRRRTKALPPEPPRSRPAVATPAPGAQEDSRDLIQSLERVETDGGVHHR
jgi:hypothetical protein